ncbi:regulatory signaling modulator protein AmpE [Colwellia sp. MSW7]|uniref:Regulatory signaling modulator protein AmpE n=1 Tax=Colwellia maritima TaxID=2912588 RepID=A0ABS9X088_9GAMM|nr:regulatory signaling modulator protein AmpE [Colwellia maritima]MCI2283167.1 regulatory signaling modulator protein AmpE [Colwellia maritima]
MSLLSLLIALAAEKSFSSAIWRFDYYYQKYLSFFKNNAILAKLKRNNLSYTIFILLPVAVVYGVLYLVEDGLLHLIISTLILIVAFGCVKTRGVYKQYLHASFQERKPPQRFIINNFCKTKTCPTWDLVKRLFG